LNDLNAIAEQLANPNRTVRYRAIYSLSKSDDPQALELLATTVRTDQDIEVRAMATKLLRKFTPSDIIEPLTDALQEDRSAQVRRAAAETLGTLANTTAKAEAALVDALYDRSKLVRRAAIQALKLLECTDAIPGLIGVMLGDSDSYVRYEAALSLSDLAPLSAIPAFAEALSADENSYVRYVAAQALGRYHDIDMVFDPLTHALRHDDNSHVRYAASVALGGLLLETEDSELVRALLWALDDADTQVWHAAAESLLMVAETAVPVILEMLVSESNARRAVALKALLWLSAEYDDDYAPPMIDPFESTAWGWWN
jgi:HEAT repeat protein